MRTMVYSDNSDPERDAYAAGVAAGSVNTTASPPARSAASATTPAATGVVKVIHLDSEDSSGPDLKEAMARSLDSFQAELARQRKEDANLAWATRASLAEARASDREEGTGSSH